jgi:hypothetical protein
MLLICALVVALDGFLFGFNTVVISGAEQSIQLLWVRFMVHETKGVPLKKMMRELGIEISE